MGASAEGCLVLQAPSARRRPGGGSSARRPAERWRLSGVSEVRRAGADTRRGADAGSVRGETPARGGAAPWPGAEQPPREDGGPGGEELPAPDPPPASPPRAPSRNELQQITGDRCKLTIVHQIVLNGGFKLQVASFSPKSLENSEGDVAQSMHKKSAGLSQRGYSAFTAHKCASLKGQIKSIADKGNRVWRVIEWRIHSFLSLFISPDGQNSQKDFPKGLDPIQEELLDVGRRFGSTIHHKRQLFGPHYSGVLKKVLLPDAEPDSDAG